MRVSIKFGMIKFGFSIAVSCMGLILWSVGANAKYQMPPAKGYKFKPVLEKSRFVSEAEKIYPNQSYNVYDPDYKEVPDTSINYSIKGMNAYDVLYKTYVSYTAHQLAPAYKEIGVANISIKGQVEPSLFYRWKKGPAEETGRSTDVYIDGNAFFCLKLPWGRTTYTMDGRFDFDKNNKLVHLSYALPILGENGEIFVPERKLIIDEEGHVISGGEIIDKIKIVSFKDWQKLWSFNSVLFYLDDKYDGEIIQNPEYTLKQGFYETGSVVKGLVGQVPEMRQGVDANAKAAKIIMKSMKSTVQLATP